jgi:O-antigen/teichoic acid export membrane protein
MHGTFLTRRFSASADRDARAIFWGFIDQTFSSATNFALAVIAGRAVGPAGLGTVTIAFSVYLIALGLQRRLLTEPLVAGSAETVDQRKTARHGLTMSIIAAGAAMAIALAASRVVPGFGGRGAFLVVPWILPALVQDFWRSVLFRDGRAAAAAVNDLAWFVAMLAMVPLAWSIATDTGVVAAWGIGATAAAALGFVQTRYAPGAVGRSVEWWRNEAWPFGKWNAGAAVAANLGGNLGAIAVAAILGAGALGGLRAAQAVFAPLTLITPALALPGLPAVTRAYARGFTEARRRALALSAVAFFATLAYVTALLLGAWRILPFLFGESFERYRTLIWPIATGQLFVAVGIGMLVLIKAQQRGRLLLVNRSISAAISLSLLTILAWTFGLEGAAWGIAAGGLASTVILTLSARREPTRSRISEGGSSDATTRRQE